MKRDMDLMRQILLEIEESDESFLEDRNVYKKLRENYTSEQITYHLLLLKEGVLIKYEERVQPRESLPSDAPGAYTETVMLTRLTWQGHEFLDAARDQNRWNQAKKTISEKGGSLTFDVLKAVLAQLARQAVGI